jgi:hypothetical protein
VIRISRKDTGKILSDVCSGWSGWQRPFTMPSLFTVTGVRYLQKVGVRRYACTATMRFATRYPNSTLNNLEELIDCAHDLTVLRFRDLEGYTYDVQVVEPPESPRNEEIKHISVYEVPIALERTGFVR